MALLGLATQSGPLLSPVVVSPFQSRKEGGSQSAKGLGSMLWLRQAVKLAAIPRVNKSSSLSGEEVSGSGDNGFQHSEVEIEEDSNSHQLEDCLQRDRNRNTGAGKGKQAIVQQSQEESGRSQGPVNWAEDVEAEEGLALAVRSENFDEKLMLVGALLRISSSTRSLQLKGILKGFWEAEHRNKEEEQQLQRNRKKERELRHLQSSVNYDRRMVVAGTAGVQGGV